LAVAGPGGAGRPAPQYAAVGGWRGRVAAAGAAILLIGTQAAARPDGRLGRHTAPSSSPAATL